MFCFVAEIAEYSLTVLLVPLAGSPWLRENWANAKVLILFHQSSSYPSFCAKDSEVVADVLGVFHY